MLGRRIDSPELILCSVASCNELTARAESAAFSLVTWCLCLLCCMLLHSELFGYLSNFLPPTQNRDQNQDSRKIQREKSVGRRTKRFARLRRSLETRLKRLEGVHSSCSPARGSMQCMELSYVKVAFFSLHSLCCNGFPFPPCRFSFVRVCLLHFVFRNAFRLMKPLQICTDNNLNNLSLQRDVFDALKPALVIKTQSTSLYCA